MDDLYQFADSGQVEAQKAETGDRARAGSAEPMTNTFTLPESSKPWKFVPYGTAIVFINEEHDPLVFADGKLEALDLSTKRRVSTVEMETGFRARPHGWIA